VGFASFPLPFFRLSESTDCGRSLDNLQTKSLREISQTKPRHAYLLLLSLFSVEFRRLPPFVAARAPQTLVEQVRSRILQPIRITSLVQNL
jgi:hypothetical protein